MSLKSPILYFTILLSAHLCKAGFLAKLVSVQSIDDFKWNKKFPYADLVIIRRLVNMYLRSGRPGGMTNGENERAVCEKVVTELAKRNGELNIDKASFMKSSNSNASMQDLSLRDVDLYLPAVSNWEPEGPPKKKSLRRLKAEPNHLAYVPYRWKYQLMKCKIIFKTRRYLEFFLTEGPQESPLTTGYFVLLERENGKTPRKMELFLADYVLLYSKDKRGQKLEKKAKKILANLENLVGYVPNPKFTSPLEEEIEKLFGPMEPTKPTNCGVKVFKTKRKDKYWANPSRSDQIVEITSDAYEEMKQTKSERYSHRRNTRSSSAMSDMSVSSRPHKNSPHGFHSKMPDTSTYRKIHPHRDVASLNIPRNKNIHNVSRLIDSRYSERISLARVGTPQVGSPRRPASTKRNKTFVSYVIAVTFAMKLGMLMTRPIDGKKRPPKQEK